MKKVCAKQKLMCKSKYYIVSKHKYHHTEKDKFSDACALIQGYEVYEYIHIRE